MSKKLLFISSFNPDIVSSNGVAKKLLLESRTFSRFGFEVDYTEINDHGVFINASGKRTFCVSWKGNYHKSFVAFYKHLKGLGMSYDVIYFRYEHISISMLSFFKQFRRNKRRLVIGELPTFMGKPYMESSVKTKIIFYLKRIMNNIWPKSIDYLVTFSEHSRLYRIPTIKIENFIDTSSMRLRIEGRSSKKQCNLLVLAQLTPAHGVDLVIKGLHEYMNAPSAINVVLHVVGDGLILENLKNLTKDLSLEDHVVFYGALGGKELDDIFDKCDIGIGALAIFRKGSRKLSELKLREYTARGLPFIFNAHEPIFDKQFFCKKIEFADKPTNIYEIVDFYQGFEYNTDSLMKMREFAESNFTAARQLGIVNEKIKLFFNK